MRYKFRGLTFDNKWVYGDLIHKRHSQKGDVYIQDKNGVGSDVLPESIGQFTGLKDKNGVEIYEGDIVKRSVPACWYADGAMGSIEDILTVKWDVQKAVFCPFDEFHPQYDIPETHREVIGNIYEIGEMELEDYLQSKIDLVGDKFNGIDADDYIRQLRGKEEEK